VACGGDGAAAAAGAGARTPQELPGPGAGVGVLPEPSGRESAAPAAARGESLGTLGPKLRMDGGDMYAQYYYAARAPKVGPRSRGGPGRFGRAWLDSDAVVLAHGGYAGRVLSSVPVLPTGPRDASAPARSTSPQTASAPASARRRGRCLKVEI